MIKHLRKLSGLNKNGSKQQLRELILGILQGAFLFTKIHD